MTLKSILDLQFDDLGNHCDVGRNKADSMAVRVLNNSGSTVKSEMDSVSVLTRLCVTHLSIEVNIKINSILK